MKALFKLSAGVALVACLACGGSSPAPPGSLVVTISGLPSGANASVTVTGPGGFSQALTATQTLTGLAAGAYTVTANNVTSTPYSYGATVTGSPATVTASASASATVTYAATTGALQVTIAGLPAGTNASVVVTGPGSFTQNVTATALLANLVPGTYTVAVTTVRAGTIVDAIYPGTGGGAAAVAAGATAPSTVTYSLVGSTGKMWIALSSGAIVGYDDSQLVSGGATLTPAVTATITGYLMAPVVDRASSVWTVDFNAGGNGLLSKFPPPQLAATGSPTVDVTIGGISLSGPACMAFDPGNGAWVTNFTGNTLAHYTSTLLATSGNPPANVTISALAGSLNSPVGLAFDSDGSLWVTNQGTDTVVKYTAAQLGTGGSIAPAVTLSPDGSGSLNLPLGLAFDSTNNLWVANAVGQSVVKFSPGQRGTTGMPTPDVTLTSPAFTHPTCVAFDKAGSLWVVNTYTKALLKFTAAQIAGTGSPVPTTTITLPASASVDLAWCSFSPAPANLPLAH